MTCPDCGEGNAEHECFCSSCGARLTGEQIAAGEEVIAEAVAASRKTDPATDLRARVIARAAWSATRAARDIWVASGGKRDPRRLVNQAFALFQQGLQQPASDS